MGELSKREEILSACFAEFSENGYEKANTNRICEAAGVSKGLLFHYFGSKKNLYIQCVEKCIEDVMMIFEDFSVEGLSFTEALAAYGQVKLQFFSTHPLHYRIFVGAFLNTPKDVQAELSKRYAELNQYAMKIMNELICKLNLKKGVGNEQVATLVTAVINIIENKYMTLILSNPDCDKKLYDGIQQDYLQMMELLLYGIAEHPEL